MKRYKNTINNNNVTRQPAELAKRWEKVLPTKKKHPRDKKKFSPQLKSDKKNCTTPPPTPSTARVGLILFKNDSLLVNPQRKLVLAYCPREILCQRSEKIKQSQETKSNETQFQI